MKLTIETARKMYNSKDESIKQFALDNYTEEQLTEKEFPKSWEELGVIKGEYISDGSGILHINESDTGEYAQNIIPKGLGESMLALMKLLQLRERYREIEKEKGVDTDRIYYTFNVGRKLICSLWFHSSEARDIFQENFKEEIELISKLYD